MSLREVRRRDKTKFVLVAGIFAAAFMTLWGVMSYYHQSEPSWLEKCRTLPVYERTEIKCP